MAAADQPRGEAAERVASGGERLEIGVRVLAGESECGELVRVVVDPVLQTLTHLVVTPRHQSGLGKLVPVELVAGIDAGAVRLNCTPERFHELDDAEDIEFLGGDTDMFGYGSDALMWPHFGLGMPLGPVHHEGIESDRVPVGEVQVRRGDQVHATDGAIGSVHGLVVDPADHHVTHILLQEGHLWGRKQIAIPIGTTSRVDAEIKVSLTKEQIEALPPIELRSGA